MIIKIKIIYTGANNSATILCHNYSVFYDESNVRDKVYIMTLMWFCLVQNCIIHFQSSIFS